MIDELNREVSADKELSNYTDDMLNQLYLRFFNTPDGILVLKDLGNRCFAFAPTVGEREAGMRDVYLSIIGRMRGSFIKEEVDDGIS